MVVHHHHTHNGSTLECESLGFAAVQRRHIIMQMLCPRESHDSIVYTHYKQRQNCVAINVVGRNRVLGELAEEQSEIISLLKNQSLRR